MAFLFVFLQYTKDPTDALGYLAIIISHLNALRFVEIDPEGPNNMDMLKVYIVSQETIWKYHLSL